MGLATLPSASEGVLCIILVNTAFPFSIVKFIIRCILLMIGIHSDTSFTSVNSEDETNYTPATITESYVEEFRSRTPGVRFDTICKSKEVYDDEEIEQGEEVEEDDCSVCFMGFEPESEINHLSCGHMFHKVCLERWLGYWNITCPLCRTPLLVSPEDDACSCPVW